MKQQHVSQSLRELRELGYVEIRRSVVSAAGARTNNMYRVLEVR